MRRKRPLPPDFFRRNNAELPQAQPGVAARRSRSADAPRSGPPIEITAKKRKPRKRISKMPRLRMRKRVPWGADWGQVDGKIEQLWCDTPIMRGGCVGKIECGCDLGGDGGDGGEGGGSGCGGGEGGCGGCGGEGGCGGCDGCDGCGAGAGCDGCGGCGGGCGGCGCGCDAAGGCEGACGGCGTGGCSTGTGGACASADAGTEGDPGSADPGAADPGASSQGFDEAGFTGQDLGFSAAPGFDMGTAFASPESAAPGAFAAADPGAPGSLAGPESGAFAGPESGFAGLAGAFAGPESGFSASQTGFDPGSPGFNMGAAFASPEEDPGVQGVQGLAPSDKGTLADFASFADPQGAFAAAHSYGSIVSGPETATEAGFGQQATVDAATAANMGTFATAEPGSQPDIIAEESQLALDAMMGPQSTPSAQVAPGPNFPFVGAHDVDVATAEAAQQADQQQADASPAMDFSQQPDIASASETSPTAEFASNPAISGGELRDGGMGQNASADFNLPLSGSFDPSQGIAPETVSDHPPSSEGALATNNQEEAGPSGFGSFGSQPSSQDTGTVLAGLFGDLGGGRTGGGDFNLPSTIYTGGQEQSLPPFEGIHDYDPPSTVPGGVGGTQFAALDTGTRSDMPSGGSQRELQASNVYQQGPGSPAYMGAPEGNQDQEARTTEIAATAAEPGEESVSKVELPEVTVTPDKAETDVEGASAAGDLKGSGGRDEAARDQGAPKSDENRDTGENVTLSDKEGEGSRSSDVSHETSIPGSLAPTTEDQPKAEFEAETSKAATKDATETRDPLTGAVMPGPGAMPAENPVENLASTVFGALAPGEAEARSRSSDFQVQARSDQVMNHQNMFVTQYAPGAGGKESGFVTSGKNLEGTFEPHTLDDVLAGRSDYVTVAGDKAMQGRTVDLGPQTWIGADGQEHHLDHVTGYVHDVGSKVTGNHLDVAARDGTGERLVNGQAQNLGSARTDVTSSRDSELKSAMAGETHGEDTGKLAADEGFATPSNIPGTPTGIEGRVIMNNDNIRSLPLDARLTDIIGRAAAQLDLYVQVYSGGQPRTGSSDERTGSHRHDEGRAADVNLYNADGSRVARGSPEHLAFLQETARLGAAGTGAGYMTDPRSIHVGITGSSARVGEGLGPYAGNREERAAVNAGLSEFRAAGGRIEAPETRIVDRGQTQPTTQPTPPEPAAQPPPMTVAPSPDVDMQHHDVGGPFIPEAGSSQNMVEPPSGPSQDMSLPDAGPPLGGGPDLMQQLIDAGGPITSLGQALGPYSSPPSLGPGGDILQPGQEAPGSQGFDPFSAGPHVGEQQGPQFESELGHQFPGGGNDQVYDSLAAGLPLFGTGGDILQPGQEAPGVMSPEGPEPAQPPALDLSSFMTQTQPGPEGDLGHDQFPDQEWPLPPDQPAGWLANQQQQGEFANFDMPAWTHQPMAPTDLPATSDFEPPPSTAGLPEQLTTEEEQQRADNAAFLAGLPPNLLGPGPQPERPATKTDAQRAVEISDRYQREYEKTLSAADRQQMKDNVKNPPTDQDKLALLQGRTTPVEFIAKMVDRNVSTIQNFGGEKLARFEADTRAMRQEFAAGTKSQAQTQAAFDKAIVEYATTKSGYEAGLGKAAEDFHPIERPQQPEETRPPEDVPTVAPELPMTETGPRPDSGALPYPPGIHEVAPPDLLVGAPRGGQPPTAPPTPGPEVNRQFGGPVTDMPMTGPPKTGQIEGPTASPKNPQEGQMAAPTASPNVPLTSGLGSVPQNLISEGPPSFSGEGPSPAYSGGPPDPATRIAAHQLMQQQPGLVQQVAQMRGISLAAAALLLAQSMPHMAGGGQAQAEQPIVVGEHGPEVFTPNVSGRITPPMSMAGDLGLRDVPPPVGHGLAGWPGPRWDGGFDLPPPGEPQGPWLDEKPGYRPPPMTIAPPQPQPSPPTVLPTGYMRMPSNIPHGHLWEGWHFSPDAWDAWLASRPDSEHVVDRRNESYTKIADRPKVVHDRDKLKNKGRPD